MTELGEALAAAVVSADPGLSRRLGTDPAAYLDLVGVTARAHGETRAMLSSAVRAARTAGHSWEAVGRVLGMSRQAAQQRFGDGGAEGETTDHNGRTRRLAPLTAFTEMDELRWAGVHGWHSIGFGFAFHDVTHSAYQWEHVRVLARSPRARRLRDEGWVRIGSAWFPWVYYKRQLDLRAEPEH